MLWYFIPVTIVATPLGQMVGDRISTDMVEAVGGILVSFVAVFEFYQKRSLFFNWFCGCFKKKADGDSVSDADGIMTVTKDDKAGQTIRTALDVSIEGNLLLLDGDFTDKVEDAVDRTMESDYTVLEEVSG